MVFAMHLIKLVLFKVRFEVLSKLVLFNVRFEVLVVVSVGCYAIHCDRELSVFQRNMPASSGYIALKMGAAGSLKILTSQKMVTCKCNANCIIIIMLLSWIRATC
jgi:hypothetical protein